MSRIWKKPETKAYQKRFRKSAKRMGKDLSRLIISGNLHVTPSIIGKYSANKPREMRKMAFDLPLSKARENLSKWVNPESSSVQLSVQRERFNLMASEVLTKIKNIGGIEGEYSRLIKLRQVKNQDIMRLLSRIKIITSALVTAKRELREQILTIPGFHEMHPEISNVLHHTSQGITRLNEMERKLKGIK